MDEPVIRQVPGHVKVPPFEIRLHDSDDIERLLIQRAFEIRYMRRCLRILMSPMPSFMKCGLMHAMDWRKLKPIPVSTRRMDTSVTASGRLARHSCKAADYHAASRSKSRDLYVRQPL
jgi:hypothetical protein